MPGYIVQQPNGKFARFSTIVDDFTHADLVGGEAMEVCCEFYDIHTCRQQIAVAKSSRTLFEECIEAVSLSHGEKLATLRRQHLSI